MLLQNKTDSLDNGNFDMQRGNDSVESVNETAPSVLETFDDGKHLLYPDAGSFFPFKTSERILDDILCDLAAINSDSVRSGILRKPVLLYSQKRASLRPYAVGSMADQIVLQTKYEYTSTTCPKYNSIEVCSCVLMDTSQKPSRMEQLSDLPIYHLKISIKTRSYLEQYKKHIGVSHFHQIKELHPLDRQDFLSFDAHDPKLIDHAIYVSDDTNKLLLLEIFEPEFTRQDKIELFGAEAIQKRYSEACKKFDSLDPANPPSGIDCINTMFKIFKGPLTRKSSSEPIKTIKSNNTILNSHMMPSWLTSKYGFKAHSTKDDETGEEIQEYEPLNLLDYKEDNQIRKCRESFTRKCLELTFLGKICIELLPHESASKAIRSFKFLEVTFSTSFWNNLLKEYRSLLVAQNTSQYDNDPHFINLSASYNYTDRDIIRNYETQCRLDPSNTGIYFDSITFIANRKNAYQMISYCSRQDLVGHETLTSALRMLTIDPDQTDVSSMTDELILSLYKNEIRRHNSNTQTHIDLRNALRVLAKYKKSDLLIFYADYEPYQIVAQGYNTLAIDETVDDDIVQTAYSIKVSDVPGLKIDCDRALYTVAIHKRSMPLFNFLLQECPKFAEIYNSDKFDYRTALEFLQVNENAPDDTILEVFQRKWSQEPLYEPEQFLNLKAALSKIAFERNSKLITHFLDTGTIDSSCLPAANWPTGLNNIGNTCYLNSLLQYYFSIAPLRDYVSNYQNTPQNMEMLADETVRMRRIGGRQVNKMEVERSIQFVYQLRDLFREMIQSQARCVTPTKELAYLAFAPSNVEVEFESTKEAPLKKVPTGEEEKDLIEATGNISEMDLMEIDSKNYSSQQVQTSTSTRGANISPDQLENALEMGRQQDVTECVGNVLSQIEGASEPISIEEDDEQYDLVKQLFYGKLKQSIIPLKDGIEPRIKIERFLSLLVNVGNHPKDIYDALDLYFDDEYLTMDEYGDVKRTISVTEFPSILQIQIQRVYYDRERFMPFKSLEPLPFKEVIYMDRYMDTKDEELQKRKEKAKEMRKQLLSMKQRQHELLSKNELGLSRKEALIETSQFLQSDIFSRYDIEVHSKEDMVKSLQAAVSSVDNELTQLYQSISKLEEDMAHNFDDFKKVGYTIFAVFIHRGEASYGHYWLYIKDFNKNGIWRKYNDETVTEAPESEVFNFTEGNTATPYFIVYVKNGCEQSIEPLKRLATDGD